MKKLLYGTTALIAAGALASGSAVGAEKVSMGVGGYMQAFFVGVDQEDSAGEPGADLRDHLVAREGEIIFNGKTTFDNGLQVGAQVQLEAEVCGDQIDESFIFFSGSWGRINIGSENSAAYLMHYSAPAPSHWAHGLQSSNFMHAGPGACHAVGSQQVAEGHVTAHEWLNLAALRGSRRAWMEREELSAIMRIMFLG